MFARSSSCSFLSLNACHWTVFFIFLLHIQTRIKKGWWCAVIYTAGWILFLWDMCSMFISFSVAISLSPSLPLSLFHTHTCTNNMVKEDDIKTRHFEPADWTDSRLPLVQLIQVVKMEGKRGRTLLTSCWFQQQMTLSVLKDSLISLFLQTAELRKRSEVLFGWCRHINLSTEAGIINLFPGGSSSVLSRLSSSKAFPSFYQSHWNYLIEAYF